MEPKALELGLEGAETREGSKDPGHVGRRQEN